MTIYISKTGAALLSGQTEAGGDANAFVADTDKVKGYWNRNDANMNMWYWALGATLTDANSFFMKFKIKTGASFTTGGSAQYLLGVRDSTQTVSTVNAVNPVLYGSLGRLYGQVRMDDGFQYITTSYYSMSTSTEYTVKSYYDTSTRAFVVYVYDGPGSSLLATLGLAGAIDGAKHFSVDSAGFWGYGEGGATTDAFSDWQYGESAKVNSGTTEESDATFSPGGTALLASQMGVF